MSPRRLLTVLTGLLLMLLLATAAWSQSAYLIIVKINPGADIVSIAAALNGQVIDTIPGGTYLLAVATLPQGKWPNGVQYIEYDRRTTLQGYMGSVAQIKPGTPADFYTGQPASKVINFPAARTQSSGSRIVVADINSLVDYSHPALQGHLTGGFDFVLGAAAGATLNQSTASFLDQSTASFLDQSTASFLDQSTASFLDQSTASFLDASNPAHGHGTLVAGVIAAYAPSSMVMPIRAFDDAGLSDTFTVSKAINYAVQNGAKVINMSFGLDTPSPTLQGAIDFADANNVVLVASAGNDNWNQPQYPSSYNKVISVAASDLLDKKTFFSNFGSQVMVSSPGLNIIAPYPGGYYAAVSGTSFSAPIVSAEVALLLSKTPQLAPAHVRNIVSRRAVDIDPVNPSYSGQLGFGRIDMARALATMRASVGTSVASNFNGTKISAGSYLWFNSVLQVNGLGSQPVTLSFTDGQIQFTVNGVQQKYAVPSAQITFSPTATAATTSFNTATGTWLTTIPSQSISGNTFLSALALPVFTDLPGGLSPVTWSGNFTSDTAGIKVQWKWGAAVYSAFAGDYNSIGVKPGDSNSSSIYKNSDHAGTPQNWKKYVIGGATGGGGSNYTGGLSGSTSVQP